MALVAPFFIFLVLETSIFYNFGELTTTLMTQIMQVFYLQLVD